MSEVDSGSRWRTSHGDMGSTPSILSPGFALVGDLRQAASIVSLSLFTDAGLVLICHVDLSLGACGYLQGSHTMTYCLLAQRRADISNLCACIYYACMLVITHQLFSAAQLEIDEAQAGKS